MKRLLGNYLILAVLTCLFAVSEARAQPPTYSQTLVPGVLLCREIPPGLPPQICQSKPTKPNSVTLTFTETPAPADQATMTVTASGDIDNNTLNDDEFIEVVGEDSVFLGNLFNDEVRDLVKTRSLSIPLSDLSTFAADGRVEITFTIPNDTGVSSARLDSVTLIYRGSDR